MKQISQSTWIKEVGLAKQFVFFSLVCAALPRIAVSATATVEYTEYSATAGLTITTFGKDGSAITKTSADAIISYSNGWWSTEVRVDPQVFRDSAFGKQPKYTTFCRKISDGTRHYRVFEGETTNLPLPAIACPLAFPPPGDFATFATWLTLCRNPDLPRIDGQKMRRFLFVPYCQKSVINHPRNFGSYSISYLGDSNGFLAELVVTNNGVILKFDEQGRVEESLFPAPFDLGFTDFHYKVLETTNVAGVTFPTRAEIRRFGPKNPAQTREDVRVTLLGECVIRTISDKRHNSGNAPPLLVAVDSRPGVLSGDQAARYYVTNDQWVASTNKRIASFAAITAQAAEVVGLSQKQESHHRRIQIIGLLVALLLIPILFMLNKSKKGKHHETKYD